MRDHLQALGPDARRAVAAAESEAVAMGYDRVGTEHLLLGLLGEGAGGAARLLSAAGATLAAARHTVREAFPPSPAAAGTGTPPRPLPTTARADRAVGRAVRLSHQQRADAVTSEHLLWGVLDVEGTAGQVLRGLGLDADRLQASLERGSDPEPPRATEPEARTGMPPPCPSCGAGLEGNVDYRTIEASGEYGPRRAVIYACAACGHVLGVSS